MTIAALRVGAIGAALSVWAAGAAFPVFAASHVGASPSWALVGDAAARAALPALVLMWAVWHARDHRLAVSAALVGALLTVGLGVALYAVSVHPEASLRAPMVAVTMVPMRQLAAAAVVAWAVWTARKAR